MEGELAPEIQARDTLENIPTKKRTIKKMSPSGSRPFPVTTLGTRRQAIKGHTS